MKHKKSQSSIDFKMMAFFFRIRDFFKSPLRKIENANVKRDDIVLDYGCGPGSYTLAASKTVGQKGKIYAADIHPAAIKAVNKKAQKKGLSNIFTIQTDCKTELEDKSVDLIMCFDVFHNVENKNCILDEFYRVLKQNGILSFDDHHMTELEIQEKIAFGGKFQLVESKNNQYNFKKNA